MFRAAIMTLHPKIRCKQQISFLISSTNSISDFLKIEARKGVRKKMCRISVRDSNGMSCSRYWGLQVQPVKDWEGQPSSWTYLLSFSSLLYACWRMFSCEDIHACRQITGAQAGGGGVSSIIKVYTDVRVEWGILFRPLSIWIGIIFTSWVYQWSILFTQRVYE